MYQVNSLMNTKRLHYNYTGSYGNDSRIISEERGKIANITDDSILIPLVSFPNLPGFILRLPWPPTLPLELSGIIPRPPWSHSQIIIPRPPLSHS